MSTKDANLEARLTELAAPFMTKSAGHKTPATGADPRWLPGRTEYWPEPEPSLEPEPTGADPRWLPPGERRSEWYQDVYMADHGEVLVTDPGDDMAIRSYAETDAAVRAGLAECDTSIVTPWCPDDDGVM